MEAGFYDTSLNRPVTNNHLHWTGSKTDLVELIYALKTSGVINNGDYQIKELIGVFSDIFNIELGNFYKTFSEIRNRANNQTKFINKLALNLVKKIEIDDI